MMLRERFFPCVLPPAAWVCFKISAKRIVACVWTHLPRAATVLPPMSSGFVGSDELSISPLKKMPLKKRRTTGEVGVANREKCETATLAATCQVIGEVWGLPLAPESLHTCLQDWQRTQSPESMHCGRQTSRKRNAASLHLGQLTSRALSAASVSFFFPFFSDCMPARAILY